MRRLLIFFLVVTTFTSCKSDSKNETTEPTKQPNIIFILADDLGWADLPNYGNEFNEAPNIETLASQGMQFTNAYAANPVCSPTRASIQTGQYPARIGINDFIPGHWLPYEKLKVPTNKTQFLPLSYETIGEAMKRSGYATGYFGKWHLGHTEKHYPKNQGYDTSVVQRGGSFFNFNDEMYPKTDFPKDKSLSEAITDLGLDFIEKNQKKPFFLFLAHYDVHVQLDAQNELIDKYVKKPKASNYPSNAVYAAMIENIDSSVGRIMTNLKKLNLEDDTIIVFFSDNGGLVSRYDKKPLLAKDKLHYYKSDSLQYIASSNKPLRAEKGTLFEGGIREPFIVKWPGKTKPGTISESIISSIDLFPTFVDMAKGTFSETQMIDGKSIVPELLGEQPDTERAIFWHYPVYHHGVPASAIRKGNYKLIHFLDDDHLELYNLKTDIGELKNIASFQTEKANELFSLLQNWRKNVDAAMPIMNPNFDESRKEEFGHHPGIEDTLNGTVTKKS
ncbi:sulfatase [Arenibacter sp. F26102]|uniref:sulfatase n=1 Tax=Arenibacter sp. F26102 TaxID=2926416 RepID=UPI001FF3F506|nr:sulfatase [Arenibacter sp. F26102]MCK0144537.1 sulfatase [Arenibacter sp. F26102]